VSGAVRGQPARLVAAAILAVGGPGLVTLLALTHVRELIPGLLYVLVIAAAAGLGGPWYGCAAAVCSYVPFNFFYTPPTHRFTFNGAEDFVAAAIFLLTGFGVGWLSDRQRRAQAYAERLQRSAEALSRAVTPAQVLDAVLVEGVAAAEARAGLIAILSEDGTTLEILATRGYPNRIMRDWTTFPVAADYPLSHAVRTGEPVFVESEAKRIERFPTLGSTGEPTHALACLPLAVEDRTIGGLVFSFGEDQEFDERRRALKVALARQAAQALERARLYEAVRSAEARVAFLAEASELLLASLDYERSLAQLATHLVPGVADWCTVDVLDDEGRIKRVAVAHDDPAKAEWGWELARRFPSALDSPTGVGKVVRTGEADFLPEVPDELLEEAVARQPELGEVVAKLGLRGWICVPLRGHERILGALSLATAESRRVFSTLDLDLAIAVAGRAGVAIENALLYRETERRADAARALGHVSDAVLLVDRDGFVRYWNPAAERFARRAAEAAVGEPAAAVVPGWEAIERDAGADEAAAKTVAVTLDGAERWLSVAAVDFGDGCVYALRDITEEHALEQARSDFVVTASHELRTPLAAVYGAARTVRRQQDLDAPTQETLLDIIEQESERLRRIVDQLLLTGRLDSGRLDLHETDFDLSALAAAVVHSARITAPDSLRLKLDAPESLATHGDEGKLRQVLANLVENAVKYSPKGGEVALAVRADGQTVRIDVSDQGLGIPPSEQTRIFDKFHRLDPHLSRGVGGSGLGLYISRELVQQMGGTLRLESELGKGSTFTVELPLPSAGGLGTLEAADVSA
jgi:signal transduction histidine kinase